MKPLRLLSLSWDSYSQVWLRRRWKFWGSSTQLHSAPERGRRHAMTSTCFIGFAAAVLLTIASPSSATESTEAPAPSPSLAATVPLYANLGSHHKRITTRVPATQQYFDQGLRLLSGLNHAAAIRSFTRAAALDPTCAMCYWGIALAYGPHVNAPMDAASGGGASAPAQKGPARQPRPRAGGRASLPTAGAAGGAAYAAAPKALALKARTTAAARACIEAVAQRYAETPPTDRAPL